jgi:hypothetical protein
MSKQAVSSIVDKIGSQRIAEALSVTSHSIRAAKTSGAMPASWYARVRTLCEAEGIDCPLTAFNFKTPDEAAS